MASEARTNEPASPATQCRTSRIQTAERPMKRVLMLSYAFPPLAASGVFRTTRFARYLPETGWQPVVLTIRDNATGTSHSVDPTLRRLIPADVRVERTTVLRPLEAVLGVASRLKRRVTSSRIRSQDTATAVGDESPGQSNPNRTLDWLAALKKRLSITRRILPDSEIGWFLPAISRGLLLNHQEPFDAIYCTSPPHSAHLIACCISKITGKPLLLDFRDPWARSPWKQNDRRWMDSRLERWCVSSASRVVLNTEAACEEFQNFYSNYPTSKFTWIPNGTDPDFEDSEPLPECNPPPSDSMHVFCHPGSVYGKRCLLPFVRALAILSRRGIGARLDQIGIVEHDRAMRTEIASLALEDSVELRGPRPHEEMQRITRNASFFLIIQPGTSTQVPAKIFEMLRFSKPLLALTGEGATAALVRKYDLGLVESSSDPERIANAAEELIARHDEFAHGDGWKRARARYDGRMLTRSLGEALDSIIAPESVTAREPA